MAERTFRIKLDPNIKKATLAGEEYEYLQTLIQYYEQLERILTKRIKQMESQMERFFEAGGDVEFLKDNRVVEMTIPDVKTGKVHSYTVEYDEGGAAIAYRATFRKRDDITQMMHKVLFISTMLPHYRGQLEVIESHLKDVKNSVTINSLVDVSKQIRGDLKTRLLTIGGVPIDEVSEAADPFDMFGDEDD